MNTSSIHEYIERNQARKNIHARFLTGLIWYYHEGTWINQKQFDKLYPHYNFLRNSNTVNNPDKTQVN
jgi:hypothetical protein